MEEHFKNKLKNHKVDWDKEELLGDIQKGLSQNQSRFDKRWLLLLPLLLISTCWGLLKVNSSLVKGEALENALSPNFNNSTINTTDTLGVDFTQATNQITPSPLTYRSSEKHQQTKFNRSLPIAENSKPKDQNLSNIKPSVRNLDTTISSINKKSASEKGSSESTKPTIASDISTMPNSIIYKEEGQNKTIHIEQLPLSETVALLYKIEIPTKPIVPIVVDIDPEQLVDSKSYLFSSIMGNAGFISRSITAPTDGQDHTEELKLNDETINARLSLSTDFMIGYQHQSGWSLESGIGYNRIIESFNFEDTISLENMDIEYEKAFYFLTQNDTLFYGGSTTVMNTETRKVIHTNYHSYFNIPLIVGYRYTLGNTNIFGSLGVRYAFGHTFKGREVQLLEGENKVVLDNPAFDIKNRIGLQFGIGVEYPLSHRTHIVTNMNYQRSPNLSRGIIDQIYHSYSLGIGIKVKL